MTNNFVLYGGKIIIELIGDILYFPLWWYTRGLLNTINGSITFVQNREKALAYRVWVKNIFKPMYAQTDWQGHLISFFMRIVQIFFRSIFMLFWIILAFIFVLLWIIFPIFVFAEIYFQLFI